MYQALRNKCDKRNLSLKNFIDYTVAVVIIQLNANFFKIETTARRASYILVCSQWQSRCQAAGTLHWQFVFVIVVHTQGNGYCQGSRAQRARWRQWNQ